MICPKIISFISGGESWGELSMTLWLQDQLDNFWPGRATVSYSHSTHPWGGLWPGLPLISSCLHKEMVWKVFYLDLVPPPPCPACRLALVMRWWGWVWCGWRDCGPLPPATAEQEPGLAVCDQRVTATQHGPHADTSSQLAHTFIALFIEFLWYYRWGLPAQPTNSLQIHTIAILIILKF